MPQHKPPPGPRRPRPLERLHDIRHRYDSGAADAKLALIARLERVSLRSARRLRAYHDDLLFLRAFPDDSRVHDAAVAALGRMERRVHALTPAHRRQLDDSGMAGTITRHAFAFGTAQWLAQSEEGADIDWHAFVAPERLDPLLRLTLTQAEADAFDSGELSTRAWLELAHGGTRRGTLAWLVHASGAPPRRRAGAARAPDPAVMRMLYDTLEVPVRWRLTNRHSTSGNSVSGVAVHPRSAMRSAPVDPVAHIGTPLASIVHLPRARAILWLDAARAALTARCREVHAITYANPDEVFVADLGGGAMLCLIGAARDERLSLEANYGFVIFANGVPIGYGGVTPLAAQANTGVNVFEAFRHAEASMLFAQSLRAFRTLFGVTRFIVNPYQFGADNDEALSSGAYWFYDRLGFRPEHVAVRALADRERLRRSASRGYRSSPATLRRLATHDLVLELAGASRTIRVDEHSLVLIASAVTTALSAHDIPARFLRRDAAIDAVAEALGIRRWRTANGQLQFGVQRLGPVIALILDDVRRWSRDDRRALVALMHAKGAQQERAFALASRAHRPLWIALRRLCRRLETASL